ncbi:unnamed protein product [Hydatigera taeniaeformis]|uniref:BTP domain-containing protein n=1 Tax=Hydatigena taeniaeformis TaxID=6205 RepID=A0A0R3WL12_HYDTA|nr:unnamed protein product [Hydatigera taeniaeformis]
MPIEILKQTLLNVVAEVINHVGFEVASVEAVEILSEVLFKYMHSISKAIADLAVEDGYFSVIDGLTIMELMNEPLSGIIKYVRESGSFFPKPPNMYMPLVGRMELTMPLCMDKTLLASSFSLMQDTLRSKEGTELPSENKAESIVGQTSISFQGRNERKLPPWAGKVQYKLACVTYDPSCGSVVERNLPTPVRSSVKRYSCRSTVSAFRNLQMSPVLSDSDYSSDIFAVQSTKPSRSMDILRGGGPKSCTLTPPRECGKSCSKTSPSTSFFASDAALAEVTPPLPSADSKSSYSPVIIGKARFGRRNSQNRKKRFSFGRKRFQSVGKRATFGAKPPASPVVEIAKVTSPVNRSTPGDGTDNSEAPPSADVSSPCPFSELKSVGSPGTVTLGLANTDSHLTDVQTNVLTVRHCPSPVLEPSTSLTPEQNFALDDSGAIGSSLGISDGSVILQKLSRSTFQIPETLTQARVIAAEGVVEASSVRSSSNNGCMKSEVIYSPTSSDSCTEPLTNEELSRDYEMPRVFNFPPTRRSSFSPSSSSLSSSSPSSSSSSPVTDSSKAAIPSVPHSSRASSPLPGSLASRQPSSINGHATGSAEASHTPTVGASGGIRIKIRLGGPEGETLSVRSSEPAITNTNSSSSTSSSSVSSPLSSTQVSDEEAIARRHSAIPPALVAKGKRHEPTSSFGSLGKTQLRAPTMPQQASLGVKTPKLVIKFGSDEHGSTSIVRSLDQQVLCLKSVLAQEKLRGSSISSLGSSSSSSTSQTTDDEDVTPVSRPPHLPVLERLPATRTSNRSSQPPALSLLKDTSKMTSSSSDCRKLPPQLRPLNIIPPSLPVLKSSFGPSKTVCSPASSFGLFSDDDEEDVLASTGENRSIRSRDSHRLHGQCRYGSKKRKIGGEKLRASSQIHPPTTQIIAASAGTSYYFNNAGEQIWLCPICRNEDDGNLMVGCDSCDDWYHSIIMSF